MESVAIFRRQTLLRVRVVKIMFASWGDECTPVKHLARVCFKPTSEELWSNSVLICLKGFLDAFIPHISFFKGGLNLLKGHRRFVCVCVCFFFFFFSVPKLLDVSHEKTGGPLLGRQSSSIHLASVLSLFPYLCTPIKAEISLSVK